MMKYSSKSVLFVNSILLSACPALANTITGRLHASHTAARLNAAVQPDQRQFFYTLACTVTG